MLAEPATLICIMPVKNEAWILPRSLACASLWADHIFVADQRSTDGSREIAEGFPKVTLVDNDTGDYSEAVRQSLLLEAARRIRGRRIIFSLDADEVLAANWRDTQEWYEILGAPLGTMIRLPKAELLPGLTSYGVAKGGDPIHGFVDDGSALSGHVIHGPRLPMPEGRRVVRPSELWLLHYKATSPARHHAKLRWYQCWERVTNPRKRAITLFRQYHNDINVADQRFPTNPEWFARYVQSGIDMAAVDDVTHTWWDGEVVRLFADYGLERFRKLDVFGGWWKGLDNLHGPEVTETWPYDPRSRFERLVHRWLRATQARRDAIAVRVVQRALRLFGW